MTDFMHQITGNNDRHTGKFCRMPAAALAGREPINLPKHFTLTQIASGTPVAIPLLPAPRGVK